MSTLNCTIKQAEPKQSKKGNKYYRLAVSPESGGADQWYTYFGNLHGEPIGARAVLALKEMGDGVIVDEYNILEPGQKAQTNAAPSTPAPATASHAGVPGHRDLWMTAMSIMKSWMADRGPIGRDELKAMWADSLDCALFAHETFAAYDAQGYSHARNLIQSAFKGSPAAKVADIAERATAQQDADARAGETDVSDPAFDDSIPF